MKKLQLSKKTSILVLILVGLLLFLYKKTKTGENPDGLIGKISQEAGEIEWKKYSNAQYQFEIQFPSYWHVFEDFSGPSPIINFYQRIPGINPPFDHFSDVPHVSIYPDGIPTDGVIGKQTDNTQSVIDGSHELNIQESPLKVIDFVLENGSSWATMISFGEAPESWSPWGFVWSRAKILNYEEKCFRGQDEISLYECNVFQEDEILRFGTVSSEIQSIQNTMVNSFRFID